MLHDSQVIAGLPVDAADEQQALLRALRESTNQLAGDAQRFSHAWQVRSPDPQIKQEVAALSSEVLENLEGLRQELGQADEPSQPQVSGFLGALLGTLDLPGPLTRLQQLTGNDPAALSLDDQRLLSEVDALFIQLNGLRAQWQDYLSLITPDDASVPRHPTEPLVMPAHLAQDASLLEGPVLPALPPNPARRAASGVVASGVPLLLDEASRQRLAQRVVTDNLMPPAPANPRAPAGQGAGGMLKVTLTLGVVLLLVIFLAYEAVAHLPLGTSQSSRPTAGATQSAPTSTLAPEPTYTSLPSPTSTTVPQPTVTPPPGAVQLSVNPAVLLVPCPGNGAATLQLVNTGSQPFNWQATSSSASVLLDGAASERGRLNPGDVALVSVTAQTANAQGTISVTYTGGSSPISVPYTVSC